MARRRKQDASPTLLDVAPDAGGAPVVEAPVAPVVVPVTTWRVTRTVKVSLFGQLTTLSEGKLVSIKGYGLDGIERIRKQVELEPVR